MGVDSELDRRIPQSTLRELRGILISSLSKENLGALDHHVYRKRKVQFLDAGTAPADTNKPTSRPSSVTRDLRTPFYSADQDDNGSETGGAARDPAERLRIVREKQNLERQRRLEELKAAALAAQRYRSQRDDERRRRIDEMRARDTDRRHQVEERKRAICEAERARREALLRRDRERDARIEGRRASRPGSAGGNIPQHTFAFGSSTPRMLEPADTGGSFWGHRRATSTSNVMFAALPLARRPSERELTNMDGDKKRATSASGLDKEEVRMSTSMYEVFNWDGDGTPVKTHKATTPTMSHSIATSVAKHYEDNVDSNPPSVWSSVARRRTDLVPTIPARESPRYAPPPVHSQSSGTGRAYSMTRLDQLAKPRRPNVTSAATATAAPSAPPRRAHHKSMVHLPQAPNPPPRKHRAEIAGLKSGEQTPGSVSSRPGSSLSCATVSVSATTGAPQVTPRRPRSMPRRPRPASIAGTGVTTPPSETKMQTSRAEKPPLPRVHSAAARKLNSASSGPVTQPGTVQPVANQVNADKPEPPKRTHKTPSKALVRLPPSKPNVQSPTAANLQTVISENKQQSKVTELKSEGSLETVVTTITKSDKNDESTTETIVSSSERVVKNVPENSEVQIVTTTTFIESSEVENKKTDENVEKMAPSEGIKAKEEIEIKLEGKEEALLKIDNESDLNKSQELSQSSDPLEGADMTGSMMARNRMITTEEQAKAALAERRRLAREEAERQAEKEKLRILQEAEEERERQRAEEERLRRFEEEALALAAAAKEAEEARLRAAIEEAEAVRKAEEERRAEESAARAAREQAEKEAREQAERARKDAAARAARDDAEREARRKRVEAIMLRTRQAKAKKDGDKSPTDENKGILGENENQKLIDNLSQSSMEDAGSQESDSVAAYESSVREREEILFNHAALHNQTSPNRDSGSIHNGANNANDNLIDAANNYAAQNGHKKSESNGIDNIINFSNLTLDNAVKQNNVTNNLLDLSELDNVNCANSNEPFLKSGVRQTQGTTEALIKGLADEDALNSNPADDSPFITSFQNNQDNNGDLSLL